MSTPHTNHDGPVMKGKIPWRYRIAKKIRRWWNHRNDIACAVESDEWGMAVVLNGGINQAGETVVTKLESCPICAAFVAEPNRGYHYAWHVGGSI